MGRFAGNDYFDRIQKRNLPILAVSAGVVELMALGQDAILRVFGWTEPATLITVAGLAMLGALAVVALSANIPARYSQAFTLAIVLILASRPLATMAFRESVYPMTIALFVFAMGVCQLDMRYFAASIAPFLASLALIAFLSRPLPQAAGILALVLCAAAIAYAVIRSRIAAHTRVFELETRIGDLEALLHLCAHCKGMRMENGKWIRIERYLIDTVKKRVSHGICDECLEKHYPHLDTEDKLPNAAGE